MTVSCAGIEAKQARSLFSLGRPRSEENDRVLRWDLFREQDVRKELGGAQ